MRFDGARSENLFASREPNEKLVSNQRKCKLIMKLLNFSKVFIHPSLMSDERNNQFPKAKSLV